MNSRKDLNGGLEIKFNLGKCITKTLSKIFAICGACIFFIIFIIVIIAASSNKSTSQDANTDIQTANVNDDTNNNDFTNNVVNEEIKNNSNETTNVNNEVKTESENQNSAGELSSMKTDMNPPPTTNSTSGGILNVDPKQQVDNLQSTQSSEKFRYNAMQKYLSCRY